MVFGGRYPSQPRAHNKFEAMPTVSASKTVLKQKLAMLWTRVSLRNREPLIATSEVWAVMPTV